MASVPQQLFLARRRESRELVDRDQDMDGRQHKRRRHRSPRKFGQRLAVGPRCTIQLVRHRRIRLHATVHHHAPTNMAHLEFPHQQQHTLDDVCCLAQPAIYAISVLDGRIHLRL